MNYTKSYIPISKKRRPGTKLNATTITIHGTGNPKSTAKNERTWLTNPSNTRTASWHIVVDDKEAIEAIPLTEIAWHAGNGTGNSTSIGIEICESGNRQQTIENAVELVAKMLNERGWGIDRLRRHYDWSKKICPAIFYDRGTWSGWQEFLKAVSNRLTSKMEIKSETYEKTNLLGICRATKLNVRDNPITGKVLGTVSKGERVTIIGRKANGWYHVLFKNITGWVSPLWIDIIDTEKADNKSEVSGLKQYEKGNFYVIEGPPGRLGIALANGRKISNINDYPAMINGVYFNPAAAASSKSVWAIAVNEGKPLGENAFTNSYNGYKRGTMAMYTDGQITVEWINNIQEYKRPIKWAIGGNALYPAYDLKYENVMDDIKRKTQHTALAYSKAGTILLIISWLNKTLDEFRADLIREFDIHSAINLDGGGSTAMKFGSKVIKDQGRKLNSIVYFK